MIKLRDISFYHVQAGVLGVVFAALPLWSSVMLSPTVGSALLYIGHLVGCFFITRLFYFWVTYEDLTDEQLMAAKGMEAAKLAMEQELSSISFLAKFKMPKRELHYTILIDLTKEIDEHGKVIDISDETDSSGTAEEKSD